MTHVYHPANRALNVHTGVSFLPQQEDPWKSRRKAITEKRKDYQVFKRLSDCSSLLDDPVSKILYPNFRPGGRFRKQINDKAHLLPDCPVVLPACCSTHRQEAEELVMSHRRFLYHSAEPLMRLPCQKQMPDKFEAAVKKDSRQNMLLQAPLSTVLVRWQLSRTHPGYDIRSLYEIASRVGTVLAVDMLSENSARVIFETIYDSCMMMQRQPLEGTGNPLYCQWLHRSMRSKSFFSVGKGLRVRNNEFLT